jgi:DNA polymerase-2
MASVTGFLLTRHWRDGPDGVELVFWAHSTAGPLRLVFTGQRAVCFTPADTVLDPADLPGLRLERKRLRLNTLDGRPVDGLYFPHQRDMRRLRAHAKEVGIPLYESDLKPHDRFLMERFIMAPLEVVGEAVERPGYLEFHNPRVRRGACDLRLSYVSLDIETDGIDGEILSIALCNKDVEMICMQGEAAHWESDLPIRWFGDEAALLAGFLEAFQALDPDLLLGWNLINFDLDYLQRRCRLHRVPFAFGRGGDNAAVLPPQRGGQTRFPSLPGRVALDGIDTLRAAFWSFESFELGFVAERLLGRKKLIEEPTGKIEEIRRLFREDRPALAAYNLEDCRLVEAIFEKAVLIDFAVQREVMTGLPLGRQGGSVAAFDNLYLPRLHRAGAVAPDVGASQATESSPGGYVMDSQPGIYDNVLVLDFKSLYPSIIRTFRIDPLGLACPGEDPVPGFLGAGFARDGAILPAIITELWGKRDVAKREGNRALIQAIKIIMNSFYGVLGSSGCRFFDPRLASSITRRGHEIIQRSRDHIEAQGYRVIYGDTDSVFVLLGPDYTPSDARQVGETLAASLNRWWQETIAREFRLESFLEIEFETHFLRFLMPTIRGAKTGCKKRYAGTVRNAKGELEVVFKGLESVRSDWTPLAQSFQRELYRRVFFREPWEGFVRETVSQLTSGALDDQLVYRKRLRQPLEAYRRNVPPHVQAARKLANPGRMIRYLITVNGPEPVSARTSPIDYQHYLDRQLAPVADGILHFLGDSFGRLTTTQLELFASE